MKKDNSKMITTFKVFESISEGIKPAYLMTLSEYQEKVSPVLKTFWKFISKNTVYLKYSWLDYGGVKFLTWDEYMDEAKKRWEKKEGNRSWEKTFDGSWEKEYSEKQWPDHKPVPKEVTDTYKDYIDFFKLVFGEKNLRKIESDETKSNKRSLRRAIEDDTYLNMLKSGEISVQKLTEIFDSVGVNVPVGMLKKANTKPIVKKVEKTPEEIIRIFNITKKILTEFKTKKINVYSLKTRMTRDTYGISYATVNSFKYIVDNWNFLSEEQKQEIENEFSDYINKIKEFVAKGDEKGGIENISFDEVLSPIIQKFKEGIQPIIDEQKKKIDKSYHETYERLHNDHETLTENEFQIKYGKPLLDYNRKPTDKYSLNSFWESEAGQLLRIPKTDQKKLQQIITMYQDDYQMNEYGKVDSLFYRLRTKYPTLIDFKLEHPSRGRNGVEFIMTSYDSNGIEFKIFTETIIAGGYNIQRAHFRWLMQVYCGEDKVASEDHSS
jgi:hypothetical protein